MERRDLLEMAVQMVRGRVHRFVAGGHDDDRRGLRHERAALFEEAITMNKHSLTNVRMSLITCAVFTLAACRGTGGSGDGSAPRDLSYMSPVTAMVGTAITRAFPDGYLERYQLFRQPPHCLRGWRSTLRAVSYQVRPWRPRYRPRTRLRR